MGRNRGRGGMSPVLKFFITLMSLGIVSFGAAWVWQNAEDKITAEKQREALAERQAESVIQAESMPQTASSEEQYDIPSEPESPYMAENSVAEVKTEKIKTASEAAQDAAEKSGTTASGEEDMPPPSGYARELAAGAVSPSPAVDYSYFSDAIFFGDSISTGIQLYMKTMVPDTAVIAQNGVSPGTALTSQCIDVNGTRVTMPEAAKTKGERTKVYIMLGSNALDLDKDSFMKGYQEFLTAIKEMYPESTIYVQSMLPVTSSVNNTYPSKNINNTRISEYNDAIRLMALNQGVNYVDVSQCMVNADGMLPTEASPLDGMHLIPEYYIKWFDYLRTHTVPGKAN